MRAVRLPSRFPVGTRYVIEGRRDHGELRIVSRQLIMPNGKAIDLAATSERARPQPKRERRVSAKRA
jgi:hypothetical protein